MNYAYLVAVYTLGCRYHSGQYSRGYRLLCLANHYADCWYGRCITTPAFIHDPELRREVAFWLRRLRHSRHSL